MGARKMSPRVRAWADKKVTITVPAWALAALLTTGGGSAVVGSLLTGEEVKAPEPVVETEKISAKDAVQDEKLEQLEEFRDEMRVMFQRIMERLPKEGNGRGR